MNNTLSLLRLLASIPNQCLSRGEIIRHGIENALIDEAHGLEQVQIISTDNTRNGEKSSLASVVLTNIGEEILDEND